MNKLRHKTEATREAVYSRAYAQALPKAYPQALPDFFYVGGSSCGHPFTYEYDGTCGLCFIKDGFDSELPKQLHRSKSLADNGNPQQTSSFQSHVQVSLGLVPPKKGQNLANFRRARKQYSQVAHGQFPITSALWELMGFQPPLAIPLIASISGEKAPEIAEKLDISIYNLQIRLQKAVKLTLLFVKA